MRLPSIEALVARAWTTFRRLPAALAAAVGVAGLLFVVIEDPETLELLFRGVLALGLLVPLLFATDVTAERWGKAAGRYSAWAGGALCALMFFLASRGWSADHLATRFIQLFLAAHLLAAFLPFARTREDNGFWQFNRTLFLRFATATLYTGVLFAGLAVALASIGTLFDLELRAQSYFRLFIFLAFVVHPWIVFSGVPRDVPALEKETGYPPGLKVFAQFVLIPLVTVYLAILTAYLFRVVATGEWPSGWIGWLVSSVSTVGMLALLLVHPVRDRDENRWVNGYARWFWVALMPSIVMLYLAVGKRIGQYGFTENRYFLLILTIWISVIAAYFAVTRSRLIRWVPVSLCAVTLITFLGPWGAYSVAERSQVNRLRTLLADSGVPDPSAAAGAVQPTSGEAEREISAVLRYLFDTRGHRPVENLLGPDAIREHPSDPAATGHVEDHGRYADDDARYAAEFLGVRYVDRWSGGDPYVFVRAEPAVFDAPEGFAWSLRVTPRPPDGPAITVGGRDVRLVIADGGVLQVEVDGRPQLEVDLGALVRSRDTTGQPTPGTVDVGPENMVFEGDGPEARVRLHLLSFGGRMAGDSLTLESADGDLFLAFPEPE